MTQATQTEAQRLAAALEKEYGSEVLDDAADKLRRLDAAERAHIRELQDCRAQIENLKKQLITEAAHTAEQKLRADQLEQQHAMQAKMHAQANARVTELEAQLEAIGAGGIEPLRKPVQQAVQLNSLLQECKTMSRVEALKTYRNKTGCSLAQARDALFPDEAVQQEVPQGWQLVPIEPTEDIEQAAADYLDECVKAHGLWLAMLAAAPKPQATHPTPQGLDARKDRDTIFFLAGWNGRNEALDAHEQFKKATIAAQAKLGEQA